MTPEGTAWGDDDGLHMIILDNKADWWRREGKGKEREVTMTRHLGPHALAIHARPWFLHVQVYSCRCCPVCRTPYPGTFPVRLGGQVRVLPSCGQSGYAGMATRAINSIAQCMDGMPGCLASDG